jgi:hypothetical protein
MGSPRLPRSFYPRIRLRCHTSFHIEAELCSPVRGWLADAGYHVDAEVRILGRRADLVGRRDAELVGVELKMRDWEGALRQAIAYQLAVDRAWVAMPLAAASSAYRQRWRFEVEGVGLLAVDDRGVVRTPIPARLSPRLLPYLRDRLLGTPLRWTWDSPVVERPAWPRFGP